MWLKHADEGPASRRSSEYPRNDLRSYFPFLLQSLLYISPMVGI